MISLKFTSLRWDVTQIFQVEVVVVVVVVVVAVVVVMVVVVVVVVWWWYGGGDSGGCSLIYSTIAGPSRSCVRACISALHLLGRLLRHIVGRMMKKPSVGFLGYDPSKVVLLLLSNSALTNKHVASMIFLDKIYTWCMIAQRIADVGIEPSRRFHVWRFWTTEHWFSSEFWIVKHQTNWFAARLTRVHGRYIPRFHVFFSTHREFRLAYDILIYHEHPSLRQSWHLKIPLSRGYSTGKINSMLHRIFVPFPTRWCPPSDMFVSL